MCPRKQTTDPNLLILVSFSQEKISNPLIHVCKKKKNDNVCICAAVLIYTLIEINVLITVQPKEGGVLTLDLGRDVPLEILK